MADVARRVAVSFSSCAGVYSWMWTTGRECRLFSWGFWERVEEEGEEGRWEGAMMEHL